MEQSGNDDRRMATGSGWAGMPSDGDEKVRRARLHDGQAMAALYARHGQAAAAYLTLQEAHDVDRIANDAFVAAFTALRSLEGGDRAFRAHVLAYAHELLLRESPSEHVREPSTGLTPEVRRLLRVLVPSQRDVITLQIASGLAVSEVASVLRLSEPSAELAQRRGLRRLESMEAVDAPVVAVPANLVDAVDLDGGEPAVMLLATAAASVSAATVGPALRACFDVATAESPRSGARRRQLAALAAAVALLAAVGSHAAGVIELPILPSVADDASDNDDPNPPSSPSGDEVPVTSVLGAEERNPDVYGDEGSSDD